MHCTALHCTPSAAAADALTCFLSSFLRRGPTRRKKPSTTTAKQQQQQQQQSRLGAHTHTHRYRRLDRSRQKCPSRKLVIVGWSCCCFPAAAALGGCGGGGEMVSDGRADGRERGLSSVCCLPLFFSLSFFLSVCVCYRAAPDPGHVETAAATVTI